MNSGRREENSHPNTYTMSKATCKCGHDTTGDYERYVDDICNGTRTLGVAISNFLRSFEADPAALTIGKCMRLYHVVMNALHRYNLSYSALRGTHYSHIKDLSDSNICRAITADEFTARRENITAFFTSLVEPMKKLERDTKVIMTDDRRMSEWNVVEASQHKMFNTVAMGLAPRLFCAL